MFSDRYRASDYQTADRKTIMNYHTRGQTRKAIINYHEEFEQTQTERYLTIRPGLQVNSCEASNCF